MSETLKVYISSTYKDLKDYREAAIQAVRETNNQPAAMEFYPVSPEKPLDKCRDDVKDCDAYIGIIGWEYGSNPPGEEKSYTELEYHQAKESGKPCFIFLQNEGTKEANVDPRIFSLRKLMQNDGQMSGGFTSSDNLGKKIVIAIYRWYNDQEDRKRKLRETLEPYFNDIRKSLTDGNLIVFLGSGINYPSELAKPKNSQLEPPPNDIDIAKHLAEGSIYNPEYFIGLPCEVCPISLDKRPEELCPIQIKLKSGKQDGIKQEQELAFAKLEMQCWSEYHIKEEGNEGVFFHKLRKLLQKRDYNYNTIQQFLAVIAASMKVGEKPIKRKPIIITTNYDYGLEKAFEENGLDIDIVYYHIPDPDPDSKLKVLDKNHPFWHKCYQIDKTAIKTPQYREDNSDQTQINPIGDNINPIGDNTETEKEKEKDCPKSLFDPSERPIIFKLYGGALYNNVNKIESSFVTAKRHYIEFFKNVEDRLPTDLKNNINPENSNILLIGYNANDANLQSILHCLLPSKRWDPDPNLTQKALKGKPQGWLIHQSSPGESNNQKYWNHWGIQLIDSCSWYEFFSLFEKYLKTTERLSEDIEVFS